MDNQRILLYAALGFVLLILWQNWQLQYGPPAQQRQAQVATETATEAAGGQSPVPGDMAIPTEQVPVAGEPLTVSGPVTEKITVDTDVLHVEIDTRGGTVSTVQLKKYPVSIDKEHAVRPDE